VITLERTIAAPLDFSRVEGTVTLESCVLSPLHVPPDDMTRPVLYLPLATAHIARTTLMGAAEIGAGGDALDSLFAGPLHCSGSMTFSNCYVVELHYLVAGAGAAGAEAALDAASVPAPTPTTTTPAPTPTATPTPAPAPPSLLVARCKSCGKISGVGGSNVLLRHLVLGTPDTNYCSCTTASDSTVTACTTCTDPNCALTCPVRATGTSFQFGTAPPVFFPDNAYPLPDFARLEPYPANPRIIDTGATNRDQLGAYNLAVPSGRRAELAVALEDALLEGFTLDPRFES